MKLKAQLFILILLFSVSAFSQENYFKMFPTLGKEYVYEISDLSYIQNDEGKKSEMLLKKRTLNLKYQTSESDKKDYLTVEFAQNSVEDPLSDVSSFKDYRYPELIGGATGRRYPDFYEGLLCRVQFRFIFDFDSSKVTLANRAPLLEEFHHILKEQGFSPQQVSERIEIINKGVFRGVTELVESLFRIPESRFGNEVIDHDKFQTKLEIQKPLMILTQNKWDKKPNLLSRKLIVDKEMNCLKEYRTLAFDTIPGTRIFGEKFYENSIQLKSARDIAPARYVLSGQIENPKSKTVTLAFLDRPFGNELRQEMVFLDDENSFQIDIPLNHPELVFLEIGRYNYIDNSRILAFYAEPGSESSFVASGENFPWNIEFSGDFKQENIMLSEFRRTYDVFNERLNFNMLQSFNFRTNYLTIIDALNTLDAFTKKFEAESNPDALDYINREVRAYLLAEILMLHSHLFVELELSFRNRNFPEQNESDLERMASIIESIKLNDLYNDYGVYSRNLTQWYLPYFFKKAQKVRELAVREYKIAGANLKFYFFSDTEMRTQLARVILAGHPFYSQVIQMCLDDLSRREEMLYQDRSYMYKKVDETLDLMLRTCNDEEFLKAVKELRKKSLQWQSDDYCPDQKFFDLEGNSKHFKDFMGEKPVIFYVTADRARERYYWDKVAEDNPELNVVFVTEGSNFTEWADYTKRAEPIAKQLLLINTEQKLTDVFLQNSRFYIAYDKEGKLLGTTSDPDKVIKLAKQSLDPQKKEIDKSLLITLVLILAAILIFVLLILFIWRWRAMQQFRKEEQRRRLRELELTAIRSQMNPHFLFNSLNSVQNLVQQNKGREAHLYLSDFAGLIRKVLNNSEKEEVSLAEELEMTTQYLKLEQLRFSFEYKLEVGSEIDVHNTMVPSMLLQPFVENAILHGLQTKQGQKMLKIEVSKQFPRLAVPNRLAHKTADFVKISVEDNGIGRKAAEQTRKTNNGKGSKLIEERLKLLEEKQGESYFIETIDLPQGTRVEIFIPEE